MGKTILIVDDSKVTRLSISFPLKKEGYEVFEAQNPIEAQKILDNNKIDMVFTDLHMPEMKGIDFLKLIRSKTQYKKLPVVMVTGESLQEKKDEGRLAGANGWVVKPIKPEQVLSIAAKFLG